MGICFSRFWRPRARRVADVSLNIAIAKMTTDSSEDASTIPPQAFVKPEPAFAGVEPLATEVAAIMPVQAPNSPASDLGILEQFPAEIRLMIYDWIFFDANPTINVRVDYDRKSRYIFSSRIIYYGGELLHTSRTICKEAVDKYWPHVTTITASKIQPTLLPPDFKFAAEEDDEPNPVDLDVLVTTLHKRARDNVVHLRNISFTATRDQVTGELPAEVDATSLLAKFQKLETVVFNEHHTGPSYLSQWSLRTRGVVLDLEKHEDFVVFPSLNTPQQWLMDKYGLDVVEDASVRKIHFMKKAIERRRARALWNAVPVVQDDDGEVPVPGTRPLAAAFIDFTSGKSYARLPDLPDEDGYELLVSWVAPKPSPPEDEELSEISSFPEMPPPSSLTW